MINRNWWHESGGYDVGMKGWGGENLDQSMKTWLCGGDMVRASNTKFGHMFRVKQDKRTLQNYKPVGEKRYGLRIEIHLILRFMD